MTKAVACTPQVVLQTPLHTEQTLGKASTKASEQLGELFLYITHIAIARPQQDFYIICTSFYICICRQLA